MLRSLTGGCLVLSGLLVSVLPAGAEPLVDAARAQVGVTVLYDPAYARLAFPEGDVPTDRGVCTDVVIRALRAAYDFDLQESVNADMRSDFSAYPKTWGLKRTDRNIDHRRVPNLMTFFRRKGMERPIGAGAADYLPGDIVTQMLPGNLPHIAVVSDRRGAEGQPLLIHNIGRGAREEDTLFAFPITGHFRFVPGE